MNWTYHSYPSETGQGHWRCLYRVRRLDRGGGRIVVLLLAGADTDIPWRPWPRLWVERRTSGAVMVALLVAGIGVAVQVGMPTG